ncbi:hypothetical protein [Shouchella clausii]|uniref:Uncharacterized protein n=1 Tax=Shouchella clausii TaxID=79880 RepID=A0A268NW35_SHOCL|nr:hypothetical protein [Shouchella clausii]PAE87628.1 hypothetical protein CHH72_17220 [Shouchella clausii]PAF27453.1 hypothetical protein CHH61_03400 [Shouchella clausii]
MNRLNKPLKPLFSLYEIKASQHSLDEGVRGSDEEYNKAIIEDMNELSIYKMRAEKAWKRAEEKRES